VHSLEDASPVFDSRFEKIFKIENDAVDRLSATSLSRKGDSFFRSAGSRWRRLRFISSQDPYHQRMEYPSIKLGRHSFFVSGKNKGTCTHLSLTLCH
jgi:hypothetical protein